MKKLMIAIMAITLGSYSTASAELGINLGVSGQMGVFVAQLQKKIANSAKITTTVVGYSSVFLEKTLGSRLTIGYDYVPSSLETDTTEDNRTDQTTILLIPQLLTQ